MVHAHKSRPAVALLSRGMSTVPLAGEMPRIPPKKRDFAAEVAALKQWWSSDRFAETKRNYTAEARASASSARRGAFHTHPPFPPSRAQDVIKLRGSLQNSFAAGEMSMKLFDTLQLCKQSGGHSRTFGAWLPPLPTRLPPTPPSPPLPPPLPSLPA